MKNKTWLVAIALLFCLLSTYAGFNIYQRLSAQGKSISFYKPAEARNGKINDSLRNLAFSLKSVETLFASSSSVDQEEFDIFTDVILKHYPSLAAIGIYQYHELPVLNGEKGEFGYWAAADIYYNFAKGEAENSILHGTALSATPETDSQMSELFAVGVSMKRYALMQRVMPQQNSVVVFVVDVKALTQAMLGDTDFGEFVVFETANHEENAAFYTTLNRVKSGDFYDGEIASLGQSWPLRVYPPRALFNPYYSIIPIVTFFFSIVLGYLFYLGIRSQYASEARKYALQKLQFSQNEIVEAEKIDAMGGLVSGIAHEVNTPLGVSITSCSYLKDLLTELKNDFDEEKLDQAQFEEFIENGNEALDMTIANLSQASKLITAFKKVDVLNADYALLPEVVDIGELVKEFVESYQESSVASHVHFEVTVTRTISIFTYPSVLTEILSSLSANSLAHAFPAEQENRVVRIRVSATGHTAMIRFEDNGIGIESQSLSKIFEPFYTTSRGAGHAGIGLSVLYNLVKSKLKSDLSYGSEKGGGFWMIFKIKDLEEQE